MATDKADTVNQYLTFTLGEELFALNINSVKEVLEHTKITKVPRTPEYMCGVINLRGHAVPIVDLRLKFGMEKGDLTVNTCLIIVEVGQAGESVALGALVDSVREVIDLTGDEVEPAPKMGTAIDTDFIRGMAKQDNEFIIILDIEKIFSAEELNIAGTAGAPPEEILEEAAA